MNRQFAYLELYVAANDDHSGVMLCVDTLDGENGMVELKSGEGEKAKSIGCFNINQLIEALKLTNEYTQHNFQNIGYTLEKSDRNE